MSTWGDLVKGGCTWTHALQIAGVPYIFTEIEAVRVDADAAPAVPSGYDAYAPALVIKDGMRVGIKIDRSTGFASGDALDLILSWDGMASGGSQTSDLKDQLFKHPDSLIRLDESIDETTGSKLVNTTSGWTASHAYIGTERVAVSVVDATHLNFTSRGLNGSQANVYSVRSPTFSRISDRPLVWRGREVTLWRVLLSPDGSVLSDTWCDTTSTLQRVIWRGYIDSPPRIDQAGVLLRALPLVRRLSLPIGHSVAAKVYEVLPEKMDLNEMQAYDDALSQMPVRCPPGSTLFTFRFETADGDSLTSKVQVLSTHPDGCYTLSQLVEGMMTDQSHMTDGIFTQLDAVAGMGVANMGGLAYFAHVLGGGFIAIVGQPVIELRVKCLDSKLNLEESYLNVPSSAPYFMVPGVYKWTHHKMTGGGGYNVDDSFQSVQIPLNITPDTLTAGFWVPVQQTEGTEFNDVSLPDTGFAVIEQGSNKLVMQWDAKIDSFNVLTQPGVTMLRVLTFHQSTGPLNIWAGSTLKYVSGKVGTVKDVILTLAESSGAGNRGSFDTLAVGQGCGIDEDFISEQSMGLPGLTDYELSMYAQGRTSVEELIGGHLALRQYCMVQRTTDPDATAAGATMPGDCVLAVVPVTAPIIDDNSPQIGAQELVLQAVSAPEAAEVPNTVSVTLSTVLDDNDQTLDVQDVPRIQAEGPRGASYSAPGLTPSEALQLSASIIAQGDGQMILQVTVAPWVELQPGDLCNLTIAHPMLYDYSSGTRAPSNVGARVLGWETSLYDGMQTYTLLVAGSAAGVGFLSPSVSVVSKPTSSSITVATDDLQWLDAGAVVYIYNPGQELNSTPQYAEVTITTISGNTVNFASSLASWVGTDSIVTYPLVANCTTRQARFVHNASTYKLY